MGASMVDPRLALDEPLVIATPFCNGRCHSISVKLLCLLIGLVSSTLLGQVFWYRGTRSEGRMVQTSAVTAA